MPIHRAFATAREREGYLFYRIPERWVGFRQSRIMRIVRALAGVGIAKDGS